MVKLLDHDRSTYTEDLALTSHPKEQLGGDTASLPLAPSTYSSVAAVAIAVWRWWWWRPAMEPSGLRRSLPPSYSPLPPIFSLLCSNNDGHVVRGCVVILLGASLHWWDPCAGGPDSHGGGRILHATSEICVGQMDPPRHQPT